MSKKITIIFKKFVKNASVSFIQTADEYLAKEQPQELVLEIHGKFTDGILKNHTFFLAYCIPDMHRAYHDTSVNRLCVLCLHDIYRRTVGDNVLLRIAKSISKEIRKPDALVRFHAFILLNIYKNIAKKNEMLYNVFAITYTSF